MRQRQPRVHAAEAAPLPPPVQPAWQVEARAAIGLDVARRGIALQSAARLVVVIAVLLASAFAVYQYYTLQGLAEDALANGRPAHTESYTAGGAILAGDVLSFNSDGRVVAGLRTNVTELSSPLTIAPAAHSPIARFVAPRSGAATAPATLAGYRVEPRSTGGGAPQNTLVMFVIDAATVATTSPVESTTAILITSSSGASLAPMSVAASFSDGTRGAVLTWSSDATAATVTAMLSYTSAVLPASGSAQYSHTAIATVATTTATASTGAPAFIAQAGTNGLVIGYQCGGSCCMRFASTASSGGASVTLGDTLNLSVLQVTACPAEALVYDGTLLVLPGSAFADVFVIDAASRSLRRQTRLPFGTIPNTAESARLVLIPPQAGTIAGFVAVVSEGQSLTAVTFRHQPLTGSFARGFATRVNPRGAAPSPAWNMSLTAAVYMAPVQRVLVMLSDPAGSTLAALVDASTAGVASEIVDVPSLASMTVVEMYSSAVRSPATVLARNTDSPAVAAIYDVEWLGGLRVAGVAADDASSGGSVSVVVQGVSERHRDLVPGHQYALSPADGTLSLAASLRYPAIVIGTSIGPSLLDVTLRHNT